MKRVFSIIFCFALLIGFFSGAPQSPGAEEDHFISYPSSAVFNSLWVGDVVFFDAHVYYIEDGPDPGDRLTVLSGDCAQIITYETGAGESAQALKFTKPGKASVMVQVEDREHGSAQKTISFTVTERPSGRPVMVKDNFPADATLKFGDTADELSRCSVWFDNLNYGTVGNYGTDSAGLSVSGLDLLLTLGGKGGGSWPCVEDDRSWMTGFDFGYGSSFAYKPGALTIQPVYLSNPISRPVRVMIEEPVINTNAPTNVTVGSTITFTTALTNTSLKNLPASEYEEDSHYTGEGLWRSYCGKENAIAYKPSVTVIEGEELVKQKNRNYSNTLASSESLTFTGTGTVKLKVTYNQFITYPSYLAVLDEFYNPTGEFDTYSPEKIITIRVTDGSVSAAPGDINGDGFITAADALLVLQASTDKITLNAGQQAAADVDGNQAVTAADALLILQYATQKIANL